MNKTIFPRIILKEQVFNEELKVGAYIITVMFSYWYSLAWNDRPSFAVVAAYLRS